MSERLLEFFDTLEGELKSKQVRSETEKFAVERLRNRARKRARITKSGLTEKAVADFLATNDSVGRLTISLPADIQRDAKHFIAVALERYTKSVLPEEVQTPLALELVFDSWRFGPGASNGVKGTHAADKINQPMTCTVHCEPLVEQLRRLNPYFSRYDCDDGITGTTVVLGSRLTTVPKNEDTERTIAIEPSGNMCLQLAAGTYLEGALRYIGLDIRKQQPLNKDAARRGSIDNSLATIDMKSASDMISLDLVSRLFPREWVWLLETIRSRHIQIPSGEWVKMHMVSTMGNGFTFPLMTLIISALIYAYRRSKGGPSLFIDWGDTCVFGDDVIVYTHEYLGVCEVLTSAGFVINTDKSYSDGPFRESCGGDFYLGGDVTPFYVKSLANPAEIYVAINQVLEWCSKTRVFLHDTLLCLKAMLGGKVFLVPEWYNPDQGVLTSQVKRRFKLLKLAPTIRRLRDERYSMMLACGGFIETRFGPSMFYMPRPRRARYVVGDSRLPKGYLDGWDPCKRSRQVSDEIAVVTAVLFA